MTEPDPLDPMRHTLEPGARAAPTPECLDDDAVAAVADGSLDAAARAMILPHLATCARCRGAVASVARSLSDPEVAREVRAVDGARRRSLYRIAIPAAAAAILLVLVMPRRTDDLDPQGTHRDPTITAVESPVPVAPSGVVDAVRTLRWRSVASADRYRVTLFDAGGTVLYEAQLTDTVAVLPDSTTLSPGQAYLWKVEARTGFDRWAPSGLVEFSIVRRAPR